MYNVMVQQTRKLECSSNEMMKKKFGEEYTIFDSKMIRTVLCTRGNEAASQPANEPTKVTNSKKKCNNFQMVILVAVVCSHSPVLTYFLPFAMQCNVYKCTVHGILISMRNMQHLSNRNHADGMVCYIVDEKRCLFCAQLCCVMHATQALHEIRCPKSRAARIVRFLCCRKNASGRNVSLNIQNSYCRWHLLTVLSV